jgi:hypothetical protein
MIRAISAVLAGLIIACAGAVRAAEEAPAPAGTWKVVLPLEKNLAGEALWLVKLDNKDGKWTGSVLANGATVRKATFEDLKVTKEVVRFALKIPGQVFRFEFRLPAEQATTLYGTLALSANSVTPAELEKTTLTSLDPFDLAKETLAHKKDGAAVVQAAMSLLGMAADKKAKPEDVRSWAARAVKASEAYGPRWHRNVLQGVVEILGEQKGYENIALTYARQAERLLDDKDRPDVRKRVLDALASTLTKAGKADEAKEVQARAKKISFAIKTQSYTGRKGKSDRVLLVELFTGTEHPASAAAVLAIDALGKTFKPSEVVRLQYHLHAGGPDPLTNTDSEARVRYYRRFIEGIPAVLVDGRPLRIEPGEAAGAWGTYEEMVEALKPLLEAPAKAKLKATATRKGAKISIEANVSDVQAEDDDIRLRVALVEEQVAYTGRNKVAEHQHVVRAFAGTPEGEKITKDKPFSKTLVIDLDEVRKSLKEYLEKTDKATPFPKKDRPLDLKTLRVVAFVQNDATHEVLQAIQVDVPE